MICFTGRCLLHTARRQGAHTSTHRHPVHTLPAHTQSPYSLHTRTAGINTRKKEYIVYITRQSELRQKSRQIKTYLVVIYGNAYTPCWPAAEQQLSSASFCFICLHNSRPFVCTAVRLSVCLLLAFLSLLFPHLPSPALPHSPSARALSVCVCACCWCCCCCCSCAHALFRATFAQIKRNFGNFETIFHATLFSFSLRFFSSYFPFCTFLY